MAEILSIDLSDERLVAMAEEMVDDHNYTGALRMLRKNAEVNGENDRSLMLYAEIYDDMCLYEKCINGWFAFLDAVGEDDEDVAECYEGIAVAFMNLGDQAHSAYYYQLLLRNTDGIDEQMREQILDDFMSTEENPLKFAYPPEIADRSDVIRSGIECMKNCEYEKAAEIFAQVEERNPAYSAARNYIAMCDIICDKPDEAQEECLKILEKQSDNVQALTTLAAVKTEIGEREEALSLAKKLLSLDIENTDEIYKVATVCCENKLHADAYRLFTRLTEDEDIRYDLSAMYFRAVAAFNCGKYEESLDIFDDISVIFPESVTARYFYSQVKNMIKSGSCAELEYFYRLPVELREKTVQTLAAFLRLPESAAATLTEELDISDCVLWCFDDNDGKGEEIKELAAHVAVKARLDDIVTKLLLDAFVSDHIKIAMLSMLAERNEDGFVGLVVCDVYKRVTLRKISVGRKKRKLFVRANAKLVAHFGLIDDDFGGQIKAAAERLYAHLESEGRLDEVKDDKVLAAAIYKLSGANMAAVVDDNFNEFFGIAEGEADKLLGDI